MACVMSIPPLMHGDDWCGQDVSGWWLSEKLDGWRAVWDGSRLVRRSGIQYEAPDWFLAGLPAFPLDCELCRGRGFDCNDVHRALAAGEWSRLRLMAFDVPGQVVELAMDMLGKLKPSASFGTASFWRVNSIADARADMLKIVAAGGEGIMLRRPGSPYLTERRTIALLKMKTSSIKPLP